MHKRYFTLIFIILLASIKAHAGAGPFGLSVGSTTLGEAVTILSQRTSVEEAGTNEWTNGPMNRTGFLGDPLV